MKPEAKMLMLIERLTRIIHNDGHQKGLKPTQWEVLRYLARANKFSKSPGAVTAYLGVTKGTVSQTITTLERKGLIEKSSAADDKRNVNVNLTRSGSELLISDPASKLATVVQNLEIKGAQDATKMLEGLVKDLLNAREGKPFGVCKSCDNFQLNAPKGNPHFCTLLAEPLTKIDSDLICVEQVSSR